MANVTYTVVKGDSLWKIASGSNASKIAGSTTQEKVNTLVKLNNITDPDYIVVGQVLILSGTAVEEKKTTTSQVTIKAFGLQADTDRTVYVAWTWTKDNTKEYQVKWFYQTGNHDNDTDGVWFVGSDSKTTEKQSTYSAPSNAYKVSVQIKPISTTHKVNGKDTEYWTGSWSTGKSYYFSNNPPAIPSVPDVSIEKYKLTAVVTNLDSLSTGVQFEILKNNSNDLTVAGGVSHKIYDAVYLNQAAISYTVEAGKSYRVRVRARNKNNDYSDWSDWSNSYNTIPEAPKTIENICALSETSVYIRWTAVGTAKSYTVEYTTNKDYFDANPSEVKSVTVESVVNYANITGMETGHKYYFRVKATNDAGDSPWHTSEAGIITIGKPPAAPTTWSSTTTVKVGEPLTLYWVHNSEDGANETYAHVQLTVNGQTTTEAIRNPDSEEEEIKTRSYTINTNDYNEGAEIKWRVRTRGVVGEYGDWSAERTVKVYAPPSLTFTLTNSAGAQLNEFSEFPIYAKATASPNTQTPIAYSLSVITVETYDTVDRAGNVKMVPAGTAVYSKHFNTREVMLVELSANNIDLEPGIYYQAICTVSMDSGLTAEETVYFRVSWRDDVYEPNAGIGIDPKNASAYITPYCTDADGNIVPGVTLSVYRREFDGGFIEIATDIPNEFQFLVIDPHPSLDYARYRIVATTTDTGAVSYYDMPAYPVGEVAAILQWDESWTNFDVVGDGTLMQQPQTGSFLRLPYNIDISENNSQDVELIEYIGREHPVSYYGTQLGHTATWNMDIPANDKETLYALRRLSRWMGDVYVREPSGSGYWANISVSFSKKHCDVVIPVTIEIARVEGGV